MILFRSAVNVHYKAPFLSLSSLIVALVAVGTLLLPWFFAYASGSFWLKEYAFQEQPRVQLTHQFLVQLQGKDSSSNTPLALVWSSSALYNQWAYANTRSMVVKMWTSDIERNGIADYFDFQISIPLLDKEDVYAARLAFEIMYETNTVFRLSMKSLVAVDAYSPLPAASLNVQGDLGFVSRVLLPASKDNSDYAGTPLNFSAIQGGNMNAMTWEQIMTDYAARDDVAHLKTSWSTHRASLEPFVITGRIVIPSDHIPYAPGSWEVLKHGWIQYLAYLLLVGAFSWISLSFLFKNGILVADVKEPGVLMGYAPLPSQPTALKSYAY